MLIRLCSESFKLGFSSTRTENFQMYKLGLENTEEPKIKLPTFAGSQKEQENSRKTSTSVSLTMLKPLTMWIIEKCGKLLKRWEYQTILSVSPETDMFLSSCMWVKKQQLEPYAELTGSKLEKEYNKAIYCHPVYLNYM